MLEEAQLVAKLKVLSEQLWEGRVKQHDIEKWLGNFTGRATTIQEERIHALFLLSHVMYFAERELRELLRAMYRDLYRYRVVQTIRKSMNGSRDATAISAAFDGVQRRTRFLALGNPSESGTHLLYWFRQENQLPRELFINAYELADRSLDDPAAALSDDVARLVFVDDFCGSGTQAVRMAKALLPVIRRLAQNANVTIDVSYLVLFANVAGLKYVKERELFDSVGAVFELDDSYKAFSADARQFTAAPPEISKSTARRLAEIYGKDLGGWPLGYKDGQLLLAFHHNIPNNSLPILSAGPPEHPKWAGAFHRFPKYYGRQKS